MAIKCESHIFYALQISIGNFTPVCNIIRFIYRDSYSLTSIFFTNRELAQQVILSEDLAYVYSQSGGYSHRLSFKHGENRLLGSED